MFFVDYEKSIQKGSDSPILHFPGSPEPAELPCASSSNINVTSITGYTFYR